MRPRELGGYHLKFKYKKVPFYLIPIFILTLLFVACNVPTFLPRETPLTVLGILEDNTEGDLENATIVLSKGKHVVEQTIPLVNNEFGSTIILPIGKWELTVLLIDADGVVKYQNTPQVVQVSLDKENLIELVLRPADSQVTIKINLDEYIFQTQALRARLHFNDVVYEVKKETPEELLETVLQLPPGSYEFKVELYSESFRAGDRLSDGIWELVHIPANQSLSLTWTPATETTTITGRIESLLPPPLGLRIEEMDQSLYLTWDPILDPELLGYFLYMQTDPLERFQLVHPLPLQETEFLLILGTHLDAEQILFTVAGLSKGGLGGYYSTPLLWAKP